MAAVALLIPKEELVMQERFLGGLNSRHANMEVWRSVPWQIRTFAFSCYKAYDCDV
jgi:hypothetical protein